MDYKGNRNLVITTRGFSFINATDAVRLPFTKIIGIETYRDGFKLLTDNARNQIHMFGHLPTEDVAFIRDATDLVTRSPRGISSEKPSRILGAMCNQVQNRLPNRSS